MPLDTNTNASKRPMDGSKVSESCAKTQGTSAAIFQSEDRLSRLSTKYDQLKSGKMDFGKRMSVKNITEPKATTEFKSRASKLYESLLYMALPGLDADTYQKDHHSASVQYGAIKNSAIFQSVTSAVQTEMQEDYDAAGCHAFRQICGSEFSLPDNAEMRALAVDYLGDSDILRSGWTTGCHAENMTKAFLKARSLAPSSAQATVPADTTAGPSKPDGPSPPQSSRASTSNTTVKE